MRRFSAIDKAVGVTSIGLALFLSAAISTASAQQGTESVFNGHRIIIPDSSIPQSGRHHTNYFYVDSDKPSNTPPSGVETPGSVACVYKLVTGPSGCPVSTSTTVPTGGWGAVALVDAGYYPTAAADLAAFSSYYGIPQANFSQVWPGKKQPAVVQGWETEEALDIEWAHAMAPQAKVYLVVTEPVRNRNLRDRSVLGCRAARFQVGGSKPAVAWSA